MNLFEVYPLYEVTPTRARGSFIWDKNDVQYLDLYGGHGVISVGHSHPHYIERISTQLKKIAFYSNAVKNPLQQELAKLLGRISNTEDYNLFLCNSGAEANENALKVASFYTKKSKIIAFKNAFHGRTSAAVSVTDNPKIGAALNQHNPVVFLPLNDTEFLEKELKKNDTCAVIIEGIQGVGGLDEGNTSFFKALEKLCKKYKALLILDEVQSGYGRSGNFFAFEHHHIEPDMITCAKGMGGGFPIAGVLIQKYIKAQYGMLGTTFGGNHLACSAAIAVLEIIEKEKLIENVKDIAKYFLEEIKKIKNIQNVKGRGLMLGLEFDFPVQAMRKTLIEQHHIFTGGAANKNLLRILPPLNIKKEEINLFIKTLKKIL